MHADREADRQTGRQTCSPRSSHAVMSPCTGCYKPFLLILYGGLAAAMR